MHTVLIFSALTVLAGAAAIAPASGDRLNRALIYWVVLPSLAAGIFAMLLRMRVF